MKRLSLIAGAAALALCTACAPAMAQTTIIAQSPALYQGPGSQYLPAEVAHVIGVDSVTHLPCLIGLTLTCQLPGTAGSSTSTPFAPTANPVSLSATTTSSNAALGTGGTSVLLANTGTVTAYYNLGTTSGVTATTANPFLLPGQSQIINVGVNTYIAAITASGSTTLATTTGTGNSTPAGGGAVTAAAGAYATGWSPDIGAYSSPYDLTYTDNSSAATLIALTKGLLYEAQQNTTLGTSIGTRIGTAAIDQTTPGSTNGVTGVAASAGGASTYAADGGANALLTATVVQVGSSGAHSLYGWSFANPNAADVFVQVFDAASGSVTLGTTHPKLTIRVPGGSATNAGFWEEKFAGEGKLAIANAISLAVTTAANGSTAPATGVQATIVYQ